MKKKSGPGPCAAKGKAHKPGLSPSAVIGFPACTASTFLEESG
ncbi:hypothetical protein [Paracoccus aurantiacus]|nr:hypothetical protein [Paracoccus aurantiacus]